MLCMNFPERKNARRTKALAQFKVRSIKVDEDPDKYEKYVSGRLEEKNTLMEVVQKRTLRDVRSKKKRTSRAKF